MDGDDRNATPRQPNPLEQTTSSTLNINDEFLDNGEELSKNGFNEEQILDEVSREYLKYGFKKVAKNKDFLVIEEMGDAFRYAGQNPPEDVIKDMVERARALKRATQSEMNEEVNDQLTYPDYLTIVHEYWYPPDEDRQYLEEAFDTLDPKRSAKLMIDDFTNLLKNCDWPEEEIDLILSQVHCMEGYFHYDDLMKLLLTPVELPKKKSAKERSAKQKSAAPKSGGKQKKNG